MQPSEAERAQLLDWARSRVLPHRIVVRSRIVLLASRGLSVREIARRVHVTPATVRLWCERFARHGLSALTRERPGRGRLPGRSPATVLAILHAMRERAGGQPPWRTRALAAAVGVSAATVWRVWKQFAIDASSPAAEIERALAQAIAETAPTRS
jgi:putative transposase